MSLAHRFLVAATFVMVLAGCTAGGRASSAGTTSTTTATTSTTMSPWLHGDPPLCPTVPDEALAAPAAVRGAASSTRVVLARSGKQCWLLPGTYDPQDARTWPSGRRPGLPATF